ncbi:MAG: ComEA family DNA-binding protein [Deltaproteobacteria bacterium]
MGHSKSNIKSNNLLKPLMGNPVLGLALVCLGIFIMKSRLDNPPSPPTSESGVYVEISDNGAFPVVVPVEDIKPSGKSDPLTQKVFRSGDRLTVAEGGKIERSRMEGEKTIALGGKIGINSAAAGELEALPGIGPSLARRIIEYREANGIFKSLEELMDVRGIGRKKYEALRNSASLD